MNHSNIPSVFIALCQKNNISQEQTEKYWNELWVKITEDWIKWLFSQNILSNNEVTQLDILFKKISDQNYSNQNSLDQILPLLSPDNQKLARDAYINSMINNLSLISKVLTLDRS